MGIAVQRAEQVGLADQFRQRAQRHAGQRDRLRLGEQSPAKAEARLPVVKGACFGREVLVNLEHDCDRRRLQVVLAALAVVRHLDRRQRRQDRDGQAREAQPGDPRPDLVRPAEGHRHDRGLGCVREVGRARFHVADRLLPRPAVRKESQPPACVQGVDHVLQPFAVHAAALHQDQPGIFDDPVGGPQQLEIARPDEDRIGRHQEDQHQGVEGRAVIGGVNDGSQRVEVVAPGDVRASQRPHEQPAQRA